MLLFCIYYIVILMKLDVSAIENYDVEVNGRLSIPRDAIEKLKSEIYLGSSDRKTVNDQTLNKMMPLTDKQLTARRNENKNDIKNYVQHLITKAGKIIEIQSRHFKSELENKKAFTKIVYIALKNYSVILQNYSETLIKDVNPIYDIDMQFVILDLIDTANELTHSECKVILSDMCHKSMNDRYKAYQTKVLSLLTSLDKAIVRDKKEEMLYVCQYFEICRTWPAYSDHLTDLIKEMLNISDVRLNYILINLKMLIKEQLHFLNIVLTVELTSELGDVLETLFNGDMVKVRNILASLRDILIQRHKLIRGKHKEENRRAKSISILIDIINKAFDRGDDELLSILFDNTIKAIRNWGDLKAYDIMKVLGGFVRYFADNLKYHWNFKTREEVKVLTEIILNRNASNENIYEYLFTDGSVYINTKAELDVNVSL